MIALPLFFLGQTSPKIESGLLGSWFGTLEYRDYSNDSRVRLGTLLTISRSKTEPGLVFRYVYDDGPNKLVEDKDKVSIDEAKHTYVITSSDGKSVDEYKISTLDRLRTEGNGQFILLGKGTENGAAVEFRETFTVSNEKLSILRESKLPNKPFAFRHVYNFNRVEIRKGK